MLVGVRIRPWLLALAMGLIACHSVQAQQEEMVQVQVQAVPAAPVIPDEQFEQWVFQEHGNAAATRKRLDALLKLKVEDVDRSCKLSDSQKKKLLLMGRGEI